MTFGSLAFALLAGILSALSPCVLPILPIVLGSAVGQHRFGPVALAVGVALSFTVLGLFIATIGYSLGLNDGPFRIAGAVFLLGFGLVLLVPSLQDRFALTASRVSSALAPVSAGVLGNGLWGQFLLGLTLGLVWSPCIGPTLGAASLLAARGDELPQVGMTMLTFALGATLPLIVSGQLSRQFAVRRRGSLLSVGHHGKAVLGVFVGLIGLAILTGLDKSLEAMLVSGSPAWLTRLSTSF